MAERQGQGHDEVCATASGHVCVCECRGRFHGVVSSVHRGRSRLGRMADVTVHPRHDVAALRPGGKAGTPSQRRSNPVTVGGGDGPKVDHRNTSVPTPPHDLTGVSDDHLAQMLAAHPDHADRIGAELDARDAHRQYADLVASVPDQAGLARMSEDDVMGLYAQVTATAGEPDPAVMARIERDLDRRSQETSDADARMREWVNRDPGGMTDADLETTARHAATLNDPAALDRVYAEWDRRAQAETAARQRDQARAGDPADAWLTGGGDEFPTQWRDEETPEERQVADLVARGWDWMEAYADVHGQDADRMRAQQAGSERVTGRTRDVLRRQYDELVHLRYIEAENGTRGHMLNPVARSRGVDPLSLFSGPLHVARANASEDLMRWWADHGRLAYTEFEAQVTGRGGAKARELAGRSNGRDFL